MSSIPNHISSKQGYGVFAALVIATYLAGCASVEQPGRSASSTPAPSAKRPDNKRAVTIHADCSWEDENGYNGKMKLLAVQNKVQDFSAAVTHPKHGTCRFDMANFHQTQETPSVELKSTTSACKVHMWTQGHQVSIAFSSCDSMCSGDAIDYLWPILADSTTGSCG
jgi:hypothetical protein